MFRLTFFRGDEVTNQVESESEKYLEGYAEGYLNFCETDIDAVIAEVPDESKRND